MADESGATGATNDNETTPKAEVTGAPQQNGAPSSQDAIEQDVGLVRPARAAPPSPPAERTLEGDIAKILEHTKLPERRNEPDKAGKRFDTSIAQSAGRENDLVIKPAESAPKPMDDEHVGAVHTLKQDLEEVVRDQKVSLVRAVALEQEKRKPEPLEAGEKPRTHIGTTVAIALLLLFLGISALGGVYYVAQSHVTPAPSTQGDSLVFAETSQTFSLDGEPSAIKTKLDALRQSAGGTLGSITRIIPTVADQTAPGGQHEATLAEFLSAIGAQPSDELLRALSSDFFLGIHTVDKNAPVIVIPVASYDHAFKGMLDWEKTLNSDLSPFFASVPSLVTGADGIPQMRTFTDVVMRNYDVRALKDDNGDIELYYSFPTRNVLIIAESPYSFPEILTRLQAKRRL